MTSRVKDEKYLRLCSEKTLQANSKGFFMDFVHMVSENVGEDWIIREFGKLKDDKERVLSIYSWEKAMSPITEVLSNVQEVYREKNAKVAEEKYREAEKAYKCGEVQKSLTLYSQSIIRAPRKDCRNILAQALWKRALASISLRKYNSAISDIQQALKEGLSDDFKADAFWKLAVCYKTLKQHDKATISFSLAEKLLNQDDVKLSELRKDKQKNFVAEDTATEQELVPQKLNQNVSGKITFGQESGKGKFAVAKELIKTGETLVVEPPYAACLLPEMFGTHCHHCFARLNSPIGCTDCSNVAFCRPECRDAAINSYHKFECKFLDLLIGSGMSILAHTALRMITQNSLDETLEIYEDRSKLKVYSLCTNAEKRQPENFFQRTLMAAFLLRCLQKGGYFGDERRDKVLPSDLEYKVGELILFHLQMLQFNAHEIYETRRYSDHVFKGSRTSYIGVAVYPTVALFNHECHPAVTRYFSGKDIVISASRPLKGGDLLAENYGPIFTRRRLRDRQRSLSSRYWFDCRCDACRSDWPTLDAGLEKVNKRVKCTRTECSYYFTLPLPKNETRCPKCKKTVDLSEHIDLLRWCENRYEDAFQEIHLQNPKSAIEILCEAIDVFYKVSCPPHKETHLAQESLQICLASFGNVSISPVKKNENV